MKMKFVHIDINYVDYSDAAGESQRSCDSALAKHGSFHLITVMDFETFKYARLDLVLIHVVPFAILEIFTIIT